jgi:hypothetical protein
MIFIDRKYINRLWNPVFNGHCVPLHCTITITKYSIM